MQDFGTKADNSPPPGGQLSAAEFNNLATENENAVLRSGLSLSGASETQLAESLFLHGVKSQVFQDNGGANAYVATPVSGAGGVLLSADYAPLDGSIIVFKAAVANTGASTLNIGQTTGTLLGTKAIVQQDGSALPSAAIRAGAYVQVRYDASIGAGSWVLLPWGRPATETALGLTEVATQAETDSGASDLVSVTPLKLRFGFDISMSGIGYIVFPSWLGGLVIQWGFNTGLAGAAKTLTFPLVWPNAMRSIVGVAQGTSTTSIAIVFDNTTLSTSSIQFRANNAANATIAQGIYWLAIGN